MKKIMLAAFLAFASSAYAAEEAAQFDAYIQSTHAYQAQMEAKLGLDPDPGSILHATCYYDDLVDHYEHDQLMMDSLTEGLPS